MAVKTESTVCATFQELRPKAVVATLAVCTVVALLAFLHTETVNAITREPNVGSVQAVFRLISCYQLIAVFHPTAVVAVITVLIEDANHANAWDYLLQFCELHKKRASRIICSAVDHGIPIISPVTRKAVDWAFNFCRIHRDNICAAFRTSAMVKTSLAPKCFTSLPTALWTMRRQRYVYFSKIVMIVLIDLKNLLTIGAIFLHDGLFSIVLNFKLFSDHCIIFLAVRRAKNNICFHKGLGTRLSSFDELTMTLLLTIPQTPKLPSVHFNQLRMFDDDNARVMFITQEMADLLGTNCEVILCDWNAVAEF